MTPENVMMFCKSYRMYFSTEKYDFIKYQGHVKVSPLIEHKDRRAFYRLSQKLNDAQIHATLLLTHFHNPTAYVTDAIDPVRMQEGVAFASRAENGTRVLLNDLYEIRKSFKDTDLLDVWLWGRELPSGGRAAIPECLNQVVKGSLSLDLASLLLLIPQTPTLNWPAIWDARETPRKVFGACNIIDRLKKADQLINWQRPGWRHQSHKIAHAFWSSFPSLPEPPEVSRSLF